MAGQADDGETRVEPGLTGRLARASDLAAIARIHKIAYSRTHFTALLSEEVLMRYYAGFLSDGTEIRLSFDSAIDGTEAVRGFAVYGVGIPDRIAAFKRASAKDIMLTALQHPWLSARKALKAVSARLGTQASYPPADFLLLSIAVAEPSRGIGKMLLSDMIAVARQRGHQRLGLYVNQDNVRAINAYYLAGFRIWEFHNGQFYMECELGT